MTAPDPATVLLVDDEELLRDLVRDALTLQGYRVLEAANGGEGLKVALAQAAGIDLLITDLVMPQLSGAELASTLRHSRPDLRVIFLSGYPEALAPDPAAVFLEKPFPLPTLLDHVHRLLETRGASLEA